MCALLHSIWSVTVVWGVLRVLIGFTNATFFMTMETWLSGSSTRENRATVLGNYQFVTYFGLALGQLMLNFAEPQGPYSLHPCNDAFLFMYDSSAYEPFWWPAH